MVIATNTSRQVTGNGRHLLKFQPDTDSTTHFRFSSGGGEGRGGERVTTMSDLFAEFSSYTHPAAFR